VKSPYIRRLGTISGLTIYAVSGNCIRNTLDIDFTQGGNEAIYPSYVPAREIWIDSVLGPRDRAATILHEMVERHLMLRHGMDYDHAHDIASARERVFRGQRTSNLSDVERAYRAFLRSPTGPVAVIPRPDAGAARPRTARQIQREIDQIVARRKHRGSRVRRVG